MHRHHAALDIPSRSPVALTYLWLLAAASAQTQFPVASSQEPRIAVEGYASVKTPPNLSNISFDVRGEGRSSDEAIAALAARTAAVERSLRSIDPALEMHSESVRVQPVRGNECKEDRYDETVHLSTGECAVQGYVASQDFSLRTARVADAGTMVGLAGRRGAYDPRIRSFGLTSTDEPKRRAIAAGLADARDKAQAIAAASGARLGSVLSVSLDGAREEEIVVTGTRIGAPPPAAERDGPVSVLINPEPVQTSARVVVTYAILR
jgi:uncharacterized protein YggE